MWPWKSKRTRNRRAAERAEAAELPPRRIARRVLAAAAVLAAVLAGLWALDQPIRTVTVTGRFQHLTPQQVGRAVAGAVHGAGLLTVSLQNVRRAVAALPWAASVSVGRAWPHGLQVWVREQHAAAQWGADGLINSRGVLFVSHVSAPPRALARLSGPEGTEAEVMRRYRAMRERLAPSGLAIAALSVDARGTWRFTLRNGITVRLGRSEVEERFDKFMSAALGIVQRRAAAISYVDMRYTNGFAIGWRKGASSHATPSEGRRVRPAGSSHPHGRLAQGGLGARPRQEGRDA